jgi:putative transposase
MMQPKKKLSCRKTIRLTNQAYRKGHAYSITIATHQRYPWFEAHPELSNKLTGELISLSRQRDTKLYAWCLMPDHVHLLLQDNELIELMRLIKGRLLPIGRRIEPGRKLWQRSFYDHALREDEDVNKVAMYIWENPMRAGIVANPVNYPMSGSLVWPDWRLFYG